MKEILDKLFDELEWCEKNDDFFDYCTAKVFAWNNNLEFYCGASKFVFTRPEWNYVIKIPRTEAIERNDFVDYIDLEVKNYEIAKIMGIEKILMPNTCVGWINFHGETVKIYQQPKYTRSWLLFDEGLADVLKKRMLYNWAEIHKITRNFFDCGIGIKDAWVGRIVQLYGMDFLRKVAEWTNKCAVNDLHMANYGVIGRNPVIIDYSGFY